MKIDIYGKNVNISERTQDYAEKKLSKLERYLPNIQEAMLELRTEKHKGKEQPVAQLTVRNTRGVVLRAEDKKQVDIFAAIDVVVDKMYQQISRYKGKSKHKKSRGSWIETQAAWEEMESLPDLSEEPMPVDEIDDYDNEERDLVIRRKSVALTPMSELEAIDQMELLGHDFFLFYNGEEDTLNVLYRREDGNFGILTPVYD